VPTFEEGVGQLRGAEAAGFGFSEPQAARLLNQGIRDYASASEWIRAILDFGPAVADQAAYDLPANVVKVKRLRLGSAPYSRQNIEALWDLESGAMRLAGTGGVFVPTFNDDGADRLITIFPTPGIEEQDLPIKGLASIFPAVDLKGSDPIPFPDDSWRGALNAAKAIAYEDVDENPDQAAYYRGLLKEEAEALRLRANSQVGQGPVRFPVAGH
jgi:hypothetical protein